MRIRVTLPNSVTRISVVFMTKYLMITLGGGQRISPVAKRSQVQAQQQQTKFCIQLKTEPI